jgi:hypothetical protein
MGIATARTMVPEKRSLNDLPMRRVIFPLSTYL